MRSAIIPGTRKKALDECPWACRVVKVYVDDLPNGYSGDGTGYHCFESIEDYFAWKGNRKDNKRHHVE